MGRRLTPLFHWPAVLALAVLLGPLLAGSPARANPPKGYHFLPYDQGLRKARAEHKMIFLYFGRYGCGYCAKTNKETFSDPSLHKLYAKHYVLVYADAESGRRLTLPSGERITEMELGARLHVVGTPLFAWLKPDGTVVFKAPGFKTVKDFKQFDRYVHGGYYKHESFSQFMAHDS
ncbi:MAG TPA: thioredoxin fold domain-containing protein [Gammaproteobacteria bacterium]|nr:thioredoxin fold domain-containing protein [Gammaproteobacteria bacterium]